MRKIMAMVVVITALIFSVFTESCSKSNHSVYFYVYGTASTAQIKYGKGSSISQAEGSGSTTINITQAQLPWKSETYDVNSSSSAVFYLYACNEGTSTPNLTIAIYDNGTMQTSDNCNYLNCYCESVQYGAN
jgi:hypothetical protein